jgi:hypothetical protein
MFARFKLTILGLTVALMLTSAGSLLLRPVAAQDPEVPALIEGCSHLTSGGTSPSPGRFSFTRAFGAGRFFINFRPAGQSATFNFDFDNTTIPGKIVGGKFQNDVNLLVTDGSNIFGRLKGASTGPDTIGVINFEGTMSIFGGTRTFLNAKGMATITGKIYTQDGTVNGVAVKANTADLCFNGSLINPNMQFGASQLSVIVFGLLLTAWLALLLSRRKRGTQS